MRQARALFLRFIGIFGRQGHDRELAEQLESDLALLIEDNLRCGLNADEARRQAVIKLGGIEQAKEAYREQRTLPSVDALWRDLRYAGRLLLKSPGFTLVAVVTLALGIGANTAIVAVMNAVLRSKLPYPHPERLVDIYNRNLKVSWDWGEFISIPLWRDWRERNHSFDDIAAFTWYQYFNLSGAGKATRIRAARVTPNIFGVLELQPLQGRGFLDDESQPGRDHVVILSHKIWKEHFGQRSDLIGKTIQLSRESYLVIGILPPDFQLSAMADHADAILPLNTLGPDASRRDLRSVIAVGRLKPTASRAAAQADLSAITAELAKLFPATDGGWDANAISLRDDLLPPSRARLGIFLVLSALILLIACLNLGVLSLARSERRRQEFAIRASLGARRARLVQQTLCESLVLSLLGTGAALFVAAWGIGLIIRFTPAVFLNHVQKAPLNAEVLGAAAAMCLLTVLLIGLLPACVASAGNLNQLLGRASSRLAGGQRWRLLLVGGEIALGLALVVGAGLLARTLHAISNLDLGFDPENLTAARITLDSVAYPKNVSRIAFFDRLLERLRGDPNTQVGAGSSLPLSAAGFVGNMVALPGQQHANANDLPYCLSVFVYPGYFKTLGTPMLAGRDLQASEPEPVVVINESMARKFFPGQDAIGRLLMFSPNQNTAYNGAAPGPRRIVGIVKDTNESRISYNSKTTCIAFFSYTQNPVPSLELILRTSHPKTAIALLRRELAQLDPAEPLYNVESVPTLVGQAMGSWRFQSWFACLAATIALLLSAIGVFGVVSHSVRQRTREIAIRVALGGQPSHIVRAMMRQASLAVACGIAGGLFAAFALTRNLSSMLFQVAPFDPISFLVGILVLAVTAAVASFVPARRATRIDPMAALRHE